MLPHFLWVHVSSNKVDLDCLVPLISVPSDSYIHYASSCAGFAELWEELERDIPLRTEGSKNSRLLHGGWLCVSECAPDYRRELLWWYLEKSTNLWVEQNDILLLIHSYWVHWATIWNSLDLVIETNYPVLG